ncbi:hypothetical protein CDL12_29617 [Handroanthus impetiginosus]|uniref:Transmembrane protein n=1 Tax=Handroanthus impetiginosus TaxID=429701 RepID=A0A2G9FXX6_9LAMI|nr:hypothetical protein CDL12_29617 [Handroanthus impetiginosus]
MVRPMPIHVSESFFPIPLAIGLFVSVSLVVALCAKHSRKVGEKYFSKSSEPNTHKAPLPSAKKLISTISRKAMTPLVHKLGRESESGDSGGQKGEEEIGLWQKAILMGEKCQPPEFSGVIYYDYAGNRIPEMPKSPRATSMSPLRSFTFPVEEVDRSMHS